MIRRPLVRALKVSVSRRVYERWLNIAALSDARRALSDISMGVYLIFTHRARLLTLLLSFEVAE